MGDGCIVDKNISSPYTHFCVLLGHMDLHRSNELRENCYFLQNKKYLYKNIYDEVKENMFDISDYCKNNGCVLP